MKSLQDFLVSLLVILMSTAITWLAYNNVTYLFPTLPAAWKHLDFWTVFFLVSLIRTLSSVMRVADIKAPERK